MGTYPILLSRPGHDKTSPVSRDTMQQHTTYSGIEGTVRLKHSFPCLLTLACGILQLRTGTQVIAQVLAHLCNTIRGRMLGCAHGIQLLLSEGCLLLVLYELLAVLFPQR